MYSASEFETSSLYLPTDSATIMIVRRRTRSPRHGDSKGPVVVLPPVVRSTEVCPSRTATELKMLHTLASLSRFTDY